MKYAITLRYTYGYGTKLVPSVKAAKAYISYVALKEKNSFLGASCYNGKNKIVFACSFKNGRIKYY